MSELQVILGPGAVGDPARPELSYAAFAEVAGEEPAPVEEPQPPAESPAEAPAETPADAQPLAGKGK